MGRKINPRPRSLPATAEKALAAIKAKQAQKAKRISGTASGALPRCGPGD